MLIIKWANSPDLSEFLQHISIPPESSVLQSILFAHSVVSLEPALYSRSCILLELVQKQTLQGPPGWVFSPTWQVITQEPWHRGIFPPPGSQMGERLTESLLKCLYAPVACCVSYFPHPDLEPLAHLLDLQVGITLFSWESTCQPGQRQGVPCLFACDEFPCSTETQTWSFQHPNPSFPSKGLLTWGARAPRCQLPATRTKTPSCHLPQGEEGIGSGDTQHLHWGRGRGVAVTLPSPFLLEDSQHESIISVMGEEVDPMPTCPWKVGENNENQKSHCWAYTQGKNRK